MELAKVNPINGELRMSTGIVASSATEEKIVDDTVKTDSGSPTDKGADDGGSSTPTGDADQKKDVEKTGIDIVREALKIEPDAAADKGATPSPSDTKKDPAEAADADNTPAKAATPAELDAEIAAAPTQIREHGLFKKVTGELKTVRGELEQTRNNFEAAKPLIEGSQALANYLGEHGIDTAQFKEMLEVGALMRANPEEARKRLGGLVEQLDDVLGNKLPADLQKKVDDGDLELADALDVSRARAKSKRADTVIADVDKGRKVEDDQKAIAEIRKTVEVTSNERIATIAAKDPDFDKKAPMMKREVLALIAERHGPKNPLRTKEQAAKLVDDAYANVNSLLANVAPAKTDIKAQPNGGKQTQATDAKETKGMTSLEITRMALGAG